MALEANEGMDTLSIPLDFLGVDIEDMCNKLLRARLTHLYPIAKKWGAIGAAQGKTNEQKDKAKDEAITDVFGDILTSAERAFLTLALIKGWETLCEHPRWVSSQAVSQWCVDL